ncbi:hypothetical protein CS542_07820 [Pedobacter sp. IW39]|nr:hypothetical protein CS542_07820 [Pedobacter sp. IW39]
MQDTKKNGLLKWHYVNLMVEFKGNLNWQILLMDSGSADHQTWSGLQITSDKLGLSTLTHHIELYLRNNLMEQIHVV